MWRLCRDMSDKGATVDLALAKIANRQHGVVSSRQLASIGLDGDRVLHRARNGRLHPLHRGVYAVGHVALSEKARCMAAVLACGRNDGDGRGVLEFWGAAISHRSAACLWRMLTPGEGPVHVLVAGDGGRRKRKGICLHRSRSLLPSHVTLRSGIPVTTPARTIADLCQASLGEGRLISAAELRRATRQANVLDLSVGDDRKLDRTRSDLEHDFLRICRRHRLPQPEVNVRVGPHLVDFLWRDRRLIVETDGYEYHRGRTAFQDDRARDFDLRARGFDVIRLAEKQVSEDSREVAAALRRLLAPVSR